MLHFCHLCLRQLEFGEAWYAVDSSLRNYIPKEVREYLEECITIQIAQLLKLCSLPLAKLEAEGVAEIGPAPEWASLLLDVLEVSKSSLASEVGRGLLEFFLPVDRPFSQDIALECK